MNDRKPPIVDLSLVLEIVTRTLILFRLSSVRLESLFLSCSMLLSTSVSLGATGAAGIGSVALATPVKPPCTGCSSIEALYWSWLSIAWKPRAARGDKSDNKTRVHENGERDMVCTEYLWHSMASWDTSTEGRSRILDQQMSESA